MKPNTTSVLVIEEHPMMRESLCAAIEAEPDLNVVQPSSNNANAFQLVLAGHADVLFLPYKPDIVILAIDNPGLEDLLSLEYLQDQWYGTPVLALTSGEVPQQEQAAIKHGAKAVLTKSASRNELLHTLRMIIPS